MAVVPFVRYFFPSSFLHAQVAITGVSLYGVVALQHSLRGRFGEPCWAHLLASVACWGRSSADIRDSNHLHPNLSFTRVAQKVSPFRYLFLLAAGSPSDQIPAIFPQRTQQCRPGYPVTWMPVFSRPDITLLSPVACRQHSQRTPLSPTLINRTPNS